MVSPVHGDYRRYQAETPLIALSRFPRPALTTKTIYSIQVHGQAFQFAAIDQLLQAELGFTKNSPATLGVREGVQLAVYALIFEGVKNNLWQFKDRTAGEAFMRELDKQRQAVTVRPTLPGAQRS
jgi:curli production assembly/transport component CsgG